MIPDLLSAQAHSLGHRPFIHTEHESFSFATLDRLVSEDAARLRVLGLQPSDVLAILLPNDIAFVRLFFAVKRLGLTALLLNTRLSKREITEQLITAQARVVFSDERFSDKLEPNIPKLNIHHFLQEALPAGQAPIRGDELPLDQALIIMFSSGTTGKAKGVVLTLGSLYYNALGTGYRLGVHGDDLWLCCLPLYHVGGLGIVFRSCLYGTQVLLRSRFDSERVHEDIVTKPISLISLVPTMLHRLMPLGPDTWNSRLRAAIMGGSAMPEDLLEQSRDLELPIVTTYGLSEAASQVSTSFPNDGYRKPGSSGQPLLFTQVKVVDGEHRPLAPHEVGEIVIKGKSLMKGYLASEVRQTVDGYFLTGDIGYMDEEGYVFVLERRKDLILSGGENIYPREIEDILRQHPAIDEAVVLGIPHPEWGQQVAATLKLNPYSPQTIPNDIDSFCQQHLASYKRPRRYQIVDSFPTTASGKIKRFELTGLF